MPAPHNPFKHALKNGTLQLGCWLGLADPYIAEISAGVGFDWLLVDAEHAPNDLWSIVAQLQVIAARGSHAVVRPPIGETWIIKQLLDAGAQSLLIPMVENQKGMDALDDILSVDGIDGVFIGPSDLAADMGFIGQAGAAEVKAAVVGAMAKIVASGKPAGILTFDTELQQQCRDIGATFIATDIDVTSFARSMRGAAKDASERLRET